MGGVLADSAAEEEPEDVKQAWEELVLIQREQERYSGMKVDLEQDLAECKKTGKRLEDVRTTFPENARACVLCTVKASKNFFAEGSFWALAAHLLQLGLLIKMSPKSVPQDNVFLENKALPRPVDPEAFCRHRGRPSGDESKIC